MFLERIENGPFFVNTYLLGCEETKEAILVDPGHEADRIRSRIDASGLRYVAIVNTHGHLDHVATAKHFAETLDVPFKMHRDDEPFLRNLAETCQMYGIPEIPAPTVDEWLEPGGTVTVGSFSFILRHAPGHSPGSLMFDLGEEMIVGDVVFQGSIGRTDLPLGDHRTLLDSIAREVLTREDGVTLHPGHGPSTTVGVERRTNPFLQGG